MSLSITRLQKQRRKMGSRKPQFFIFFLLYLLLGSGSGIANKPPPEAIQLQIKYLYNQEKKTQFSFPESAQLDTIPTINPTTTTTTPFVSPPTPLQSLTPTSPTTTNPSPTTPTTNPNPTASPTTPSSSGGSWCIANPSASETALQVALDYACGYGGADCSAIQRGGTCYNPNSLRDHASYAFNEYYKKNPSPTSCVFGGTAQLTNTDPSSGNCHFSSSSTSQTSPTPPTPVETPTAFPPPSPTSIYTPGTPSGPTVLGSEPTGSPNSAASKSCSFLLLFTAAYFLLPSVAANHI